MVVASSEVLGCRLNRRVAYVVEEVQRPLQNVMMMPAGLTPMAMIAVGISRKQV